MLPLQHVFKLSSVRSRLSPSILCHFYRLYVRNFFTFAFIVTLSRQLFGEAIVCHVQDHRLSLSYLETACYINGTFTMYNSTTSFHHSYYQWVPLLLLLESLIWHVPFQWAWNCLFLVIDIDPKSTPPASIQAEVHRSGHHLYWKTLFLESLYLVILLCQPFLLNAFLNQGLFASKSVEELFPKEGKCFVDYYAGGDLTAGKFICLLPFNVFYAKVFLVIFVGFWVCLAYHLVVLVYRLMIVVCPVFRRGPYREDLNRWWFYQIMLHSGGGSFRWELKTPESCPLEEMKKSQA